MSSKLRIFIPGNVSSSKNSKVWTGKFLVNSKQTTRYKKQTEQFWLEYKDEFVKSLKKKEKPYKIGFHFVRDSKRKWDFVNPVQTVQDQMVHYEWLEDDNITEMMPYPLEVNGELWSLDRKKPGVYIEVL